jgi:hypothetical protein
MCACRKPRIPVHTHACSCRRNPQVAGVDVAGRPGLARGRVAMCPQVGGLGCPLTIDVHAQRYDTYCHTQTRVPPRPSCSAAQGNPLLPLLTPAEHLALFAVLCGGAAASPAPPPPPSPHAHAVGCSRQALLPRSLDSDPRGQGGGGQPGRVEAKKVALAEALAVAARCSLPPPLLNTPAGRLSGAGREDRGDAQGAVACVVPSRCQALRQVGTMHRSRLLRRLPRLPKSLPKSSSAISRPGHGYSSLPLGEGRLPSSARPFSWAVLARPCARRQPAQAQPGLGAAVPTRVAAAGRAVCGHGRAGTQVALVNTVG